MATKRKTTKKVMEIPSTEEFINWHNDNATSTPVVEETTTEQVPVTEAKPKATKTLKRYNFMSTINALNISNVIFENVNVIVYSCKAASKSEAIAEYKNSILKRFHGSKQDYDRYITSVFGNASNVLLDEVDVNNFTTEIITL